MRKFLLVGVCLMIAADTLPANLAFADIDSAAEPGIVISAVQPGDSSDGGEKNEVIELWNTSSEDVDMTGWTLSRYSSVAKLGDAPKEILKFASNSGVHLFLEPNGREAVFSSDYKGVYKIGDRALEFPYSLTDYRSALVLKDAQGAVIDMVGWGTSLFFEGEVAPKIPSTQILYRTSGDTNSNHRDFTLVDIGSVAFSYNNFLEIEDTCINLDGLQLEIPDEMKLNNGMCVSVDVCPNMPDIQLEVPPEFEIINGECAEKFKPLNLQITELLPNPIGADEGHEFIELYNPTIITANLHDYYLMVSKKAYYFPESQTIEGQGYYVLDTDAVNLTLSNASGVNIQLMARGGVEVSESPAYAAAPIAESWALITGEWQYTNQPTPGAENIPNIFDESEDGTGTALAQCKVGWYRSPETGRCRKIVVAAAASPCKEGQYRSEETGRCRSIISAVTSELKPCGDGQFRNPDTGRCKKIASTDDLLQPCAVGYERNPETNRCRKAVSDTVPSAAFPIAPAKGNTNDTTGWLAFTAVAVLALGYGIWEWRHEIAGLIKRGVGIFVRAK